MKINFFKSPILSTLMLALVTLSFSSCGNDDDTADLPLKDRLAGTWDINSYKLGGDEYMGLLFESAYLKFDAYTGTHGQIEQGVVFPGEGAFVLTGIYSVDEENDEVNMEYEGDTITAQIEITGNKLVWQSLQDGYTLELKATRR